MCLCSQNPTLTFSQSEVAPLPVLGPGPAFSPCSTHPAQPNTPVSRQALPARASSALGGSGIPRQRCRQSNAGFAARQAGAARLSQCQGSAWAPSPAQLVFQLLVTVCHSADAELHPAGSLPENRPDLHFLCCHKAL